MNTRIVVACVSAVLALSQIGSRAQETVARQLVLKGATAIDVVRGSAVPNSVIVIQGDKIKAFGGRETAYSPSANVVDVSGKFIIPGLVDSHTHYQTWMGELDLNYGITTAVVIG